VDGPRDVLQTTKVEPRLASPSSAGQHADGMERPERPPGKPLWGA